MAFISSATAEIPRLFAYRPNASYDFFRMCLFGFNMNLAEEVIESNFQDSWWSEATSRTWRIVPSYCGRNTALKQDLNVWKSACQLNCRGHNDWWSAALKPTCPGTLIKIFSIFTPFSWRDWLRMVHISVYEDGLHWISARGYLRWVGMDELDHQSQRRMV